MNLKRALLVLAAASSLLMSSAACIINHIDGCDGGTTIIPAEPAYAQGIYVLNLPRSAVNLTATYAGLITRINGALGAAGIRVEEYAILPQYGGINGEPALIYGEPASTAGDLPTALGIAATSGFFDAPLPGVTAEQYNLSYITKRLETATLPPELTGGTSKPFFSTPKDLFFIITVHSAQRKCSESDAACALDGVTPVEAFSAENGDGTAAWLKLPGGSQRKPRVLQAFVTTSEAEEVTVFESRCKGEPGFPITLLDVLAPSPMTYYGELATGLKDNGWTAERIDLCETVSASGPGIVKALAAKAREALAH